ncbi:MAG TPA: pyridoxamine 5'-phosphate oxidase family protein [Pseudomonadales bacterium]|nr:pyridoxamine 5'-phosphate oxidase family protein [Pseudomonadales bacterium]
MPLSRKLALDAAQIDEIMLAQWNLRIATLGPGTRINLTPMWFGWASLGEGQGLVYIYARGQKVVNLRRQPECSLIVDRNERFPELQGIMIQGKGAVLEDAAAEAADPHLQAVRVQMGRKYNGGHGSPAVDDPPPFGASARGAHARWIVVTPDHQLTWDNFKLATLKE